MRYTSTRGQSPEAGFIDVLLAGLAPDGGLYVPVHWPRLPDDILQAAATAPYAQTAAAVLKLFAGDDLDVDTCALLADEAYGGQWASPAITPLVQVGPGEYILELFHGPSLAFKDVAMQLLAGLYAHVLEKRGTRLTVVCATSGDTGGAAVEALKSVEAVDLFVLLPDGRVSDVQRRFMTGSGSANVHPVVVGGDFDAAQSVVKALFADPAFAAEVGLRIMIATNANDGIARVFSEGRYTRTAASTATLSPAMDISVASNFERIMFEAVGRDPVRLKALYDGFAQSGSYPVDDGALAFLQQHFDAFGVDDDETRWAMGDALDVAGQVLCPHTAVGWRARFGADEIEGARVLLATAHPAKFPETVQAVLGRDAPLPSHCADLFDRRETTIPCPVDPAAVKVLIKARRHV